MKGRSAGYVATLCLLLSVILWNPWSEPVRGEQAPQLGRASIDDVIAAMTLEEKATLVVGTGMSFPGASGGSQSDSGQSPAVGATRNLVPGAAGTTAPIPRLGIPATVLADGPAGLRISPTRPNDDQTYHTTAFPIATLLASSWDTELAYRVGRVVGNEVLEYGVDVLLAPALNIHRNPLCGRNFEYYSEDPLVAGKMAAAMVNGVESQGVGTSIKHFAANNQETNRNTIHEHISQRALREIYLAAFRIAVQEAQPWTVMSSYNRINGTYTSESRELLTSILRGDWGFQGYVMTDWFGGSDPVAQMTAANDLLMPGTPRQREAILAAVREGRLDEKVLDENIRRILEIVVQTPRFRGYQYSNKPDLATHARVAREAAAQGMVLLKNENGALPLKEGISIALFGNAGYDTVIGGTGSGDVNEAYSVSIAEGLRNAGFSVYSGLEDRYLPFIEEEKARRPQPRFAFLLPEPIDEMPLSENLVQRAAEQADLAVLVIGRNSGEGGDRKEDGDFYLTDAEEATIQTIGQTFRGEGKRLVVVLNIGGVVETASWKMLPDAILLAWQPGQEAGNAVTDVLAGKVNPSGKLASTFPVKYGDVPSSRNFPGIEFETEGSGGDDPVRSFFGGKPSEVTYEEDIFVGYRYFTTFDAQVSYEFGFGLSYTQFSFGNLQLAAEQLGNRQLSVEVTNTGEIPGKEVVQVYLKAPSGRLAKPEMTLVAFAKTKLLRPRETETLRLPVSREYCASFDEEKSSWVLEPGTYEIRVGASSRDIRLETSFEIAEEIVVKEVSNSLAPEREIAVLKP